MDRLVGELHRPIFAGKARWISTFRCEMAQGKGIYNLTGGGTQDTTGKEGAESVFNKDRYPATYLWFERFKIHMERMQRVEKKISEAEAEKILAGTPDTGPKVLPTPAKPPPKEVASITS